MLSILCLMELTFQVAIRMNGDGAGGRKGGGTLRMPELGRSSKAEWDTHCGVCLGWLIKREMHGCGRYARISRIGSKKNPYGGGDGGRRERGGGGAGPHGPIVLKRGTFALGGGG